MAHERGVTANFSCSVGLVQSVSKHKFHFIVASYCISAYLELSYLMQRVQQARCELCKKGFSCLVGLWAM